MVRYVCGWLIFVGNCDGHVLEGYGTGGPTGPLACVGTKLF
jgi:hypothetical protein